MSHYAYLLFRLETVRKNMTETKKWLEVSTVFLYSQDNVHTALLWT